MLTTKLHLCHCRFASTFAFAFLRVAQSHATHRLRRALAVAAAIACGIYLLSVTMKLDDVNLRCHNTCWYNLKAISHPFLWRDSFFLVLHPKTEASFYFVLLKASAYCNATFTGVWFTHALADCYV